ncbi:SH3 domain-containing protein [Paraclostridium bifermentans]|uniref:SH3 domain-containing protein n=1 Tax=Paraclostridium bifermentans TaxID=1490 RepID=A0AA44IGZ0_PARBF|nr:MULTISPECIES: SH3 domain-containing protein [Paraclostridium]MBN8046667.1 SH3 domain-containing protein [Paraclostridium bifermentans]MBZ6004791.1 SH3 domain-containing protein [Paraclostridium bifermentans]MDU0296539.1 SH3 domain-containing protein [Paraclostridium sp. MRS3W1]NME09264.1 SH3 domain-containing protein [Paraclostridium bifermentans]
MSMNKRAKKSIVLTLGLVVGGMYASTNSIFAAEKEIVTPEKLNVRKGPSVENDKIGSLDRGMVVEILESNNGWNKVKLSDGNEGWVSGDYTAKEKATVTATELNVRKGPSIENDKIGSLANGTVVEVLEHENDWYKVKLDDNQEGWICGDYALTESQAMEQQAKKTEVKAATTNTVDQKNDSNDSKDSAVKEEKSEEAVSNNEQNNNQNNNSNESSKTEETTSSNNNSGRLMTVNASAYAGHSITATGTTPKWGTIAVDPSVIPYGTKVYIPKFDMVFTAEDCGGAIKGNKIDIFMNSESECTTFGRQNIEIQILG